MHGSAKVQSPRNFEVEKNFEQNIKAGKHKLKQNGSYII